MVQKQMHNKKNSTKKQRNICVEYNIFTIVINEFIKKGYLILTLAFHQILYPYTHRDDR